jgi:hypothetical protein
MALENDRITVALWKGGGQTWGACIRHDQGLPWFFGDGEPKVSDAYDFYGEGPITDQVLQEISALATELLSYSAERVMGLQLALF